MTRTTLRRGVGLLAAIASLLVLSALPGVPPPVAAADDGIDVRTATTYTLVPDARVVRVVVQVAATNTKPSTTVGGIVRRFYYPAVQLAVQPEATNIRATSGGHRLATKVDDRKGYRRVVVTFRSRLFYGQSADVRVAYDLPGGKPRSASEIRVGRAFASFYAWANGDVGSVRIIVPDTFDPTVSGAELTERRSGGRIVFNAPQIESTATWYAIVNADRSSSLGVRWLTIPTGESVAVRAWPEDPEWRDRVADRLERGLPELDGLIGLPWPVTSSLLVTEVHTPLLEGYAGIYHPDSAGIEISEDLDDLTILHEAAHAWFNGELFDGRWINEGLASSYATKALSKIGIFSPGPLDFPRTDPSAFPLNDWPPLGRIDDDTVEAREQYGYETSFRVVQQVVTLAGDDAMRRVLAAAANHEIAYVGAGPVEHRPGVPDWRAFLDYLDERAGSSNAGSLFRLYVVAPGEVTALAARTKARDAYARLVADGRGWQPAYAIRSPLAAWDFGAATEAIATAESVLDLRDRIAVAGAPAGLVAPDALRTAYEGAESDLSGALAAASTDLSAATAIGAAAPRIAAPRDPLTIIGLAGFEPATVLEAAKSAYRADRAAAAEASVAVAMDALERAPDQGARTVGAVGAGAVVLVVVGGVVVVRRRRERHLPAVAAPGAIWGPGVIPAGTLPSQPGPEPPGPEGALEPIVSQPIEIPPGEDAF